MVLNPPGPFVPYDIYQPSGVASLWTVITRSDVGARDSRLYRMLTYVQHLCTTCMVIKVYIVNWIYRCLGDLT